MEFKDYYKILGVDPEADGKEIKTAYRRLARKYHPDVNPEKGAEDKFKEVAEAYEVLKDSNRRAEYDELCRYGAQGGKTFEQPPGWTSGSSYSASGGAQFNDDFSDFFNTIFGNKAGGFYQSAHDENYGFKGQDIEIEMPVFLEDTLADTSKTIEYHVPAYEQGYVKQVKKSLKVKIPKGVVDGERVRLKAQGAPGQGSGANGDLYLHIRLVPHPLFDVEGHNLTIVVPLSPWEAALGTKVTVPTLTGKINLNIAPDSQSGQKLRIKGKGLQSKAGTGDLYAILKIVMPEKTTEETKKLWQALAEKAEFDPRAEWRS